MGESKADMDEKEQQLRAQLEQVTSALSLKQAAVKQSNVKMAELQLRTAKEQTLQKSDVKPGKTAASRVLAPSSLTNKVDAPAQGCKPSTASATQKKSSSFLPDDFKSELAQIRSELKNARQEVEQEKASNAHDLEQLKQMDSENTSGATDLEAGLER